MPRSNNETKDESLIRKGTASKMNDAFNAVRAYQKRKPEHWSLDKRTQVNEQIKLIQWLFDERMYERAANQCEHMLDTFRVRL